MALKSGRVGVAPDQVDPYGRLQPTQWLIDQLRELLDTNEAEVSAQRIARQELQELHLDEPIIQKPITPITPVADLESFPSETTEEAEPEEVAETEEEADGEEAE